MDRTIFKAPSGAPIWAVYLVSVTGLLIFYFLALQAAIINSPTFDEGTHLLRGLVLWDSADLSLQGEHAPLSHWIIGSLFFSEPTAPNLDPVPSLSERSSAGLGWEFLWSNRIDVNRFLLIGRLPIIFAGLILGALVARWAKILSGLFGLIVVTVLFAFSPNLLASSSVATTDLMATVTFTAALFTSWYYWRRPTTWRWLLSGIMLGLALSSKLTAVLLLPLTLLLTYANWFRLSPGTRAKTQWWRPGLIWLGSVIVAGAILWAVYGFEVGEVSGLPFPIPAATYVENFIQVQGHINSGHSSFLLGDLSFGWWHYFIIAYLIKTPAVVLVLLVLTIVYLFSSARWGKALYLWFPAAALLAVASFSRLNIGYRHILPMIPLIWVLITFSKPFWLKKRGSLVVLSVLLAYYAFGTLRYQPHFLAYFNEFIGGPSQGYKYLGDSNLDWGQDLRLVANYVGRSDSKPVLVAYYGIGNPSYYGLEVPPIFDNAGNVIGFARANPAPGRYIISTSRLQGAADYEPHLFDWFRRHEPDEQVGFTFQVYDVPNAKNGAWIGHCLDPEPRLTESEAEQVIGISSLQHHYFDCQNSWLIPAGNEPGWYILPFELETEQIRGLFGDRFTLVFANAYSPKTPTYKVYYWEGGSAIEEQIIKRSQLVTEADGEMIKLPTSVGSTATFLGGWGDAGVWTSAWQAGSDPGEFLSVMMHLHVVGTPPLVGDGLGYPSPNWQPGDIIMQIHDFGDQPADYLETGLYDYNTVERLPFTAADSSNTSVRISPD